MVGIQCGKCGWTHDDYDCTPKPAPTVAAQQCGQTADIGELVKRQQVLVEHFNGAVASLPEIAARVSKGQQFNEWERASNDEDGDPDDWEYLIGIGPVGDLFAFERIEGQRQANLIASALKLAAFSAENARALTALEAENKALRSALEYLANTANAIIGADPYDEEAQEAFEAFNVARDQARTIARRALGEEHDG